MLVLIQRADGVLITPPWLGRDGGLEVPTTQAPPAGLARTVATCTLALPIQLCRLETIEETERRIDLSAWEGSPWLDGELVLVLETRQTDDDERYETELDGHRLRYDRQDGLVVTRSW